MLVYFLSLACQVTFHDVQLAMAPEIVAEKWKGHGHAHDANGNDILEDGHAHSHDEEHIIQVVDKMK